MSADLTCPDCGTGYWLTGATETQRAEAVEAWRGCCAAPPTLPIFEPDAFRSLPVIVLGGGALIGLLVLIGLLDAIARTG